MYVNNRGDHLLSRSKWNQERIISFIILIVGSILFIIGSIMLGIGIHKSKKKEKDCPRPLKCPDQSSQSLYHFSIDSQISWIQSFSDLKNNQTQAILKTFINNVTNLFNNDQSKMNRLIMSINPQSTGVWPDFLMETTDHKTMFYGSFGFLGNVDVNDIQLRLQSVYKNSTISDSSKGFCEDLISQPTPPPSPIGDFPCDPRNPSKVFIIMIDASKPIDPQVTADQKLDYIKSYLQSISLPNSIDWDDYEMGIGLFYGANAYLVNNWLCNNQTCLDEAINQIMINNTCQSHNATRAFEFIRDEFINSNLQLRPGRGRALTILADGFEYDGGFGEEWSRELVQVLAQSFSISTIIISPSQTIQQTYSSFSLISYRSLSLDYWYQIEYSDIRSRQFNWICQAPILLIPPSTPMIITEPPINFTTTSSRNTTDLPRINPFCQDPTDLALIIHQPSIENFVIFQSVLKFITGSLLQSFAGLDSGNQEKLTRIAILTYYDRNVSLWENFGGNQNMSSTIDVINHIPYAIHTSGSSFLSLAYQEAFGRFNQSGRIYATWSIIVITEELSEEDSDSATHSRQLLNSNGISIFGIGTQEDIDHYKGIEGIWNNYTLTDGRELEDGDGEMAIRTSNEMRDLSCIHYPGEGRPTTSPITSSTQFHPGILQQGTLTPQQWPDIVILIETQADLSPNSQALNDRGFEVIRLFLVNTLIHYKIGGIFTRVALVTFDGKSRIIFNLNEHDNWESLYLGLTENWQYGPSTDHSNTKNIDDAFNLLADQIYQPDKGLRVNRVNYLWYFTTGTQNLMTRNNNYMSILNKLGEGGVNVFGIGLGDVDPSFMKNISIEQRIVQDYDDPLNGLASPQDLLRGLLFQISTSQKDPVPPFAKLNSDVVLAIDREMNDQLLQDLKQFLINFIQGFTIGETDSRFALIIFDSNGINQFNFMKDGFDKDNLINDILSFQSKSGPIMNADYQKALDFIVYNISISENGKRSDSSNLAVFYTASGDNNYSIPTPNALVELNETYFCQVNSLNDSITPDFLKTLASKPQYVYPLGTDLLDWSIPIGGQRSPIQDFFSDMLLQNLHFLQKNPLKPKEVCADVSLILDMANLDEIYFQNMKQYLQKFISKFSIGVFDVQFSGQSFADVFLDGFNFTTCVNLSCIEDQIGGWERKENSNNSLLTSVLDDLDQIQLVSQRGWRQSKTYVIIFSAANSVTWDPNEMSHIQYRLHNKNAFLYYIDMANGSLSTSYQSLFDEYEILDSPNELSDGSKADQEVIHTLTNDYQTFRYPPPLELSSVVADFVFILDLSTFIVLYQTQSLLENLVLGLNISNSMAKVSLISYTGDGLIPINSFLLNHYLDQDSLIQAISSLSLPDYTNETDFGGALEYLETTVLDPRNGYRGQAAFVTFFNANPNLMNPLNNYAKSISNLQSRPFLNFYAFDLSSLESGDQVYNAFRMVIPAMMAATQIRRTDTVLPGSTTINGGDGYINYILNAYAAFIAQPIEPPTGSPTGSSMTTMSMNWTSLATAESINTTIITSTTTITTTTTNTTIASTSITTSTTTITTTINVSTTTAPENTSISTRTMTTTPLITTTTSTTQPPTTSFTYQMILADVIFLLDTSSSAESWFNDYIDFALSLMSVFSLTPDDLRVGMITVNGDDSFIYPTALLGQITDQLRFYGLLNETRDYFSNFKELGQNTGRSLDLVISDFIYPSNGYRDHIKNHWLIYITSSPNINDLDLARRDADFLKSSEYYSMAGISYKGMTRDEISSITGGIECTFVTDDRNELLNSILFNIRDLIFNNNNGNRCIENSQSL